MPARVCFVAASETNTLHVRAIAGKAHRTAKPCVFDAAPHGDGDLRVPSFATTKYDREWHPRAPFLRSALSRFTSHRGATTPMALRLVASIGKTFLLSTRGAIKDGGAMSAAVFVDLQSKLRTQFSRGVVTTTQSTVVPRRRLRIDYCANDDMRLFRRYKDQDVVLFHFRQDDNGTDQDADARGMVVPMTPGEDTLDYHVQVLAADSVPVAGHEPLVDALTSACVTYEWTIGATGGYGRHLNVGRRYKVNTVMREPTEIWMADGCSVVLQSTIDVATLVRECDVICHD
ncbi:Aste57867_24176 [Aphanomyces stellatus]|uniref:Aste57867_24176 protein n=1 Tax=Aphanomyces stellatus TaxID=120398 RepID=A0A485LPR6_9STRA|nr:hypothetical protein As57867_024102 [Aphanomyces stellatus]VFU00818.1 Aste57867_24176 [Aphanomyces stellatus]